MQALAAPLRDIQQGAGQVRQNIKDSNWLFIACIFVAGVMIGLFAGYTFVIRTQNTMDDRMDRIEKFVSAPAKPVSTVPDLHAPAHKGKAK